jgi:hypothetical protein
VAASPSGEIAMRHQYRDEFHRFGHMFHPKRSYPSMYICLRRWTGIEGNQTPLLSVDLIDDVEIDRAFDELKYDLEQARRQAKAALKRRKVQQKAPNPINPQPLATAKTV